jgi:hypothetical protein
MLRGVLGYLEGHKGGRRGRGVACGLRQLGILETLEFKSFQKYDFANIIMVAPYRVSKVL